MNRNRPIVHWAVAGLLGTLLLTSTVFARSMHATAGCPGSIVAVTCWDNSGAFMTKFARPRKAG